MAARNLQIRERHRDLLRPSGFLFCDDHAQDSASALSQAAHRRSLGVESCSGPLQDLICEGVELSSCDHDLQQNIGATFWTRLLLLFYAAADFKSV